jgi:RimJ/RimL family protein N-acetyltransferase
VGICGLVRRPELEGPDLGFAFTVEHCGKGYATESGRVVVEHAHTVRSLDRLLAITTPENSGSIRVLEKLGFRLLETRTVFQEEEPLCIFGRSAGEALTAPHNTHGS